MIESKLSQRVAPSKGRQLFNMASQYDNVINLTLGDPDIIPLLSVREAGCKAIMEGKTRYSANAGIIELRKAYADFINRKYATDFLPDQHIIVTVGGMEALYLALLSSVNPGDEVIIFAPYYINYYQMIEMCGGHPVVIEADETAGFVPQLEEIRAIISDKTKMIIINTPSNPTGAVYPVDVVNGIVEIAKENRLLLVSDEVYSSLVYDGAEHFSVLQSEVDYKDILFVDSCSKRFSMTGWRIGFAAGPVEWVEAMTKLQENVAACAPLPSQYAALKAFREEPDMTEYLKVFKRRRDILAKELSVTKKLSFSIPKGTFYLFVNVEKTGRTGMDFAIELLKEKRVAVVPGVAYGDAYENYIRIAFTLDEEKLLEAAKRIIEFVENCPESL